jgi:hypothetical protein
VMHPLIPTIRASSVLLVHVNETGVLLLYGSRGLRVVHACLIVLYVAWADLPQSSSQSIADGWMTSASRLTLLEGSYR